MNKTILCIAATALSLASAPADATVLDPQGDFLGTYTGPQNSDLDALALLVTFTPEEVTLTATLNGTIGTTAGSAFIWGVDRGSGTDRLITSGPPAVGPADLLFDAVIRLESGGGGRVLTFPASGPPVTTLLDPSTVLISGSTISATIPFSLLPSTGFALEDYTYVFWTRSELGSQAFIADLAPDAAAIEGTAVPEPATWAMVILGFAFVGFSIRIARLKRPGLNAQWSGHGLLEVRFPTASD
jgi:PEP-CTERM motif